MAYNDEARELFQTFSLLGGQMSEGYKIAREKEEKERRKARREQLLLTLFGPAVAEGVTGLIKAPFEEPVNKFLSSEGSNIYDPDGKIVGYNRGGLDVKRFASGYKRLRSQVSDIEKAATRNGLSVYDYFQDGAITNYNEGLKNVVGDPDWQVHALLEDGNIRDAAKPLGELDYDEYVRAKAYVNKIPEDKVMDAEIARRNPYSGNWGQAGWRTFRRLIRRESRDTVMERNIRQIEDVLGIEFTQEALDEARTIIDKASRVGDAYSIPTQIDKLIADNPKLGEKIGFLREEARTNLTRDLENASWRKSALAGTHGSAAKRFVLANKDANPIAFSDAMTEKINIPSLSKANQDLFAAIIQNDSSVQTEIEQLREHITQYEYDMTYEDLRDDEDTTRMTRVDSFVDDSLRSIYGAAQMKSVEQITGLMDLGRTQELERLGIFDPNSMRGQAAVLSNMRGILRHNLDTRDVETGWWLWKETNPQLTGGINLEELMSTTFNSSNLGNAARVITEGVPSAQARSTERLDNLSRDVFEMVETKTPEEIIAFINNVEPVLTKAGLRLPPNVRELRTRLEGEMETDPSIVQQYYARFIEGDPNLDVDADYPERKVPFIERDAREKLSKGLQNQWYDIGRPLYEERQSQEGTIQRGNIVGWFKGRSKADRIAFEKEVRDAGGSVLDLHQETFWDAKEVDIIAPLSNASKGHVNDRTVKSISDWFMRNPQHLQSLAENNYNLIEFVIGQQFSKK